LREQRQTTATTDRRKTLTLTGAREEGKGKQASVEVGKEKKEKVEVERKGSEKGQVQSGVGCPRRRE
jgi:hypothetical protein